MTSNRVLTAKGGKGKEPIEVDAPGSFDNDPKPAVVATLAVNKPGDVIKNLQDVVARLQAIEKLNNNLQGQYMQGSAAWESCEKVDDQLHEIFTLLGE